VDVEVRLVKQLLASLAVSALCCGCSLSEKPQIEVVSSVDEITEAIKDTPTTFIIPFAQDRPAFARLKVFFEQHAKGTPLYKNNTIEAVTASGFRYAVTRSTAANGIQYDVKCGLADGGNGGEEAMRNAQSLSRFIMKGELEGTLLS
jgi:hypothetical protein